MDYFTFKSLHIIFVVTWFAGLFYVPRLFIYHTEALAKPEPDRSILSDQLAIMTRRLWFVITWPSAIITLIFASILLILIPDWLTQTFMQVKLGFVFMLYLYHLSLHRIYAQLQKGVTKYTSMQLRMWNEVSTVILIAVVFLVIKRDGISWLWGIIGILGFAVLLTIAIRFYKKLRERNHEI